MTRTVTTILLAAGLFAGCAKRVPLPYEKVEPGSRVWVRTTEQKSLSGDVIVREPDRFVLQSGNGAVDTLLVADVASMKARKQEYDEAGRLIPEREVDSVKTSTNLLMYTVGGGALSFGVSFYLGNFLKRHTETGEDVALWATTGAGTLVGLAAFANAGAKRDRLLAIERIKDHRKIVAEQQLEVQKDRKTRLEEELKRLKEEQRKKQEELERLKKLLEKKKREPE